MLPLTLNKIAEKIINPNLDIEFQNLENYYSFNQESPAIQELRKKTTPEIENNVKDFVNNIVSFDFFKLGINELTIDQYLAAAKLIDMRIPTTEMTNTTFQVRLECLKKDKELRQGTNKTNINMVNVFIMPNEDETDPLLLNEINNAHPSVKNDSSKRNHMYNIIRNEIYFHPEAAEKIYSILWIFFNSIAELNSKLPKNTTQVFRGCSGSGKSYSITQKFGLEKIEDVAKIALSTDAIMTLFVNDPEFNATQDQSFILGMSCRIVLETTLKQYRPTLSLVQEGWYKIPSQIDALFVENRLVDIKDFDGDFREIALRMLVRFSQKDISSSPLELDIVWRNYCECRESRSYLISKLRKEDTYSFQYSFNGGDIRTYKTVNPNSFVVDLKEKENVEKDLITQEDFNRYGQGLEPYIGMTFPEAYQKASSK